MRTEILQSEGFPQAPIQHQYDVNAILCQRYSDQSIQAMAGGRRYGNIGIVSPKVHERNAV